jgi:hypothetical protein
MSRHLIAEVKPSASFHRQIRLMAAEGGTAMLQPQLNRRQTRASLDSTLPDPRLADDIDGRAARCAVRTPQRGIPTNGNSGRPQGPASSAKIGHKDTENRLKQAQTGH